MTSGTMRSLIKSGLAGALHLTGADTLLGRTLTATRYPPLVICYHRVVEDFAASARNSIPAMLISRRMLEQHLDWIGRRYHFVTLDELGAMLTNGPELSRPVATITFDDGYRDVYDHGVPLLERKGIPGAVFVVSGLVGTRNLQVFDRLFALLSHTRKGPRGERALARALATLDRTALPAALSRQGRDVAAASSFLLETLCRTELERFLGVLEEEIRVEPGDLYGLSPLTWEMVRKMLRRGMTIGSHTESHALLTSESPATVLQELRGSRERLCQELDIPIVHFAYPDGRFDDGVVDLVSQAGYRFAYTTCRHRSAHHPCLTIPRQVLWERACLNVLGRFSPAVMSCHAREVFGIVSGCRQQHASAHGTHNHALRSPALASGQRSPGGDHS